MTIRSITSALGNSSRSLAMVSRFNGSGVLEGIGAALRVGMGLMWGVGMGFERNIVGVAVGGSVTRRRFETAAPVVSPIGLEAFYTFSSW